MGVIKKRKEDIQTRIRKRYAKGELAKEILKGLASGGFVVACFAAPNFAQVAKMFGAQNSKERWRLKRTLANLTKEKLVQISYDKKGNEVIKITSEGEKRYLKYKFDEIEIEVPKKWDKTWRLVIYDIPETLGKARRALVCKLEELGFYPLQKSALIFPFDCRDEIDFVCEHLKIREYVNYFEVKKPENEEYLKEWFGL